MIPAPDACRCDARHSSSSLRRCFRVSGHRDEPHHHEEPVGSPTYNAVYVRQWRDETCPAAPSEFAPGPYVEA